MEGGRDSLSFQVQQLIDSGLHESSIPELSNHIEQLRALSLMMLQIDEGVMGALAGIYRHRIQALQMTLINGVGELLLSHLQNHVANLSLQNKPRGLTAERIEAVARARIARETGADCPVCLLDMEKFQEIRELPCRHAFHKGCID